MQAHHVRHLLHLLLLLVGEARDERLAALVSRAHRRTAAIYSIAVDSFDKNVIYLTIKYMINAMPSELRTVKRSILPPKSAVGRGGVPFRRRTAPLVRRLQQICVSMIAQALEGSGLVQLEFALMVFIDDVAGIDQRTLSQAMGIDRNNVSLLLDRLEERGLVTRAIGDDRRTKNLSLTALGKALCDVSQLKTKAVNDRILAPLQPAERKLFLDMLLRLVEAHQEHARPGAGRRKRRSANGDGKE